MIREEFKEFISRGSAIDMAVGIIIGGAFTSIVNSMVQDILMPPIGLLLKGVDFTNQFLVISGGEPGVVYRTLAEAKAAGVVTINHGQFLNAVISFLIMAVVLFVMVTSVNRLKRLGEDPKMPDLRACPRCYSSISIKASRCPSCTSEIAPVKLGEVAQSARA